MVSGAAASSSSAPASSASRRFASRRSVRRCASGDGDDEEEEEVEEEDEEERDPPLAPEEDAFNMTDSELADSRVSAFPLRILRVEGEVGTESGTIIDVLFGVLYKIQ